MKFMLIVKATDSTEKGVLPSKEVVDDMIAIHQEMANAGVLLGMNGLLPTSKGARIQFDGGQILVIDGPFSETKELIAGYTMIEASNLEEAIGWAKKFPAPHGPGVFGEIEVRQVFGPDDFPEEIMDREAMDRLRAEADGC